jgi:hypothetical protein
VYLPPFEFDEVEYPNVAEDLTILVLASNQNYGSPFVYDIKAMIFPRLWFWAISNQLNLNPRLKPDIKSIFFSNTVQKGNIIMHNIILIGTSKTKNTIIL